MCRLFGICPSTTGHYSSRKMMSLTEITAACTTLNERKQVTGDASLQRLSTAMWTKILLCPQKLMPTVQRSSIVSHKRKNIHFATDRSWIPSTLPSLMKSNQTTVTLKKVEKGLSDEEHQHLETIMSHHMDSFCSSYAPGSPTKLTPLKICAHG